MASQPTQLATSEHLPSDDLSWLSGGGEMGELIRNMDWSATPLGPLRGWPQSLRTSVSLCLSSTFPILVAWGPDDIQIYNDAYRPICGAKHPEAMGQPFKVCWATALPVVGDAFDRAHLGEGVYIRDQRMFLDRYGYLEEAFMTFSFSPIRVESGNVGGVFHPITESTAQVLNARRTQSLRDLTESVARSRTMEELCALLARPDEKLALDLPFMLLYELAPDGAQLRLRASFGVAAGSALAPLVIDALEPLAIDALAPPGVAAEHAGWDFAAALAAPGSVHVAGLAARFGAYACGPYEQAPFDAMLLPVAVAGQERPYGYVVAGVSACRALDADYLNFYELLRGAFSTAVGNVLAYQQEQRRAEQLAEIDRAKTAFFSNVSHEFRTPLTLILGPLEDALADVDQPLAPRQRQRIDVTSRNALRLLKLVNSLLDFSRIEAGRVQASYAPTDLARLTADFASVFTAAMEKAGLDYRVDVRPLPQPVYVDHDMWEKIVFNLLSNAFKFTLAGGVTLTLLADGDVARLTVSDTGHGIAASELPKVFDRFHRVEGAQGRSYEGTGIGLALIQELVKLHGGGIAASSVEGFGSTFSVEIPFGSAHLAPERLVAHADMSASRRNGEAFFEEALRWLPDEAAPDEVPTDHAAPAAVPVPAAMGADGAPPWRPRILIADDNSDMRAYLKSLLQDVATVDTCADGVAALAAIERGAPDLLLSDVMMPRLDGFGLLAALRTNPATRNLPVILLSARAGEEAKVEGLQAGADDYLVKPFAARELLARVHGQLEQARQRGAANLALQQREAYFRALVDTSPAMFWTTDAGAMGTYLSQRWYDYTGRAVADDLGLGWLDAVHADDRPRTRAGLMTALAQRTAFSVDYRLRGSDGQYRWMIGAGAPRFDDAGQLAGFVGTVLDVHERALLQDRFARVTQAGGIGVCYADAPFDTLQANGQLRLQLSLDDAVIGVDQFYRRVHAADRDGLRRQLNFALAGATCDVEFRVEELGATVPRWLRLIGWTTVDAHGRAEHFDGVTLDISAHKRAEEVLRTMADELSEANRVQRDFLVTLAHELRNPLAPIRSGLEMMRVARLAGQSTDDIRAMMERQVGHLVHLVDDLLDLARIARGKEFLRRTAVTVAEVVSSAVEISLPLIEAKRHLLRVALPEQSVTLDADPHRIAQVIGNLLNNAAKYTPPGGAIDINAAVVGDSLRIAVSDNGVGIPEGSLASVFDLFTQVQGSEEHAQGGLGIGLNLVRRLVELHGGAVDVRSAGAGHGSTFTLTLPLPPSLPAAPASPAPPVSNGDSQAAPAALKVLVVDDNHDAAEILSTLLEFKGHVTSVAHDGRAALAAAATFRPDVIFLDIGLPGLTGYEVAQALRADADLAATTLVAMTGWGADEDRQRSRAAGFDHHLTKPVSFDVVDQLLAELAGKLG